MIGGNWSSCVRLNNELAAQARLGLTNAPSERMSEEQIGAIVNAFGGLLGLLRHADQHDRSHPVR